MFDCKCKNVSILGELGLTKNVEYPPPQKNGKSRPKVTKVFALDY